MAQFTEPIGKLRQHHLDGGMIPGLDRTQISDAIP